MPGFYPPEFLKEMLEDQKKLSLTDKQTADKYGLSIGCIYYSRVKYGYPPIHTSRKKRLTYKSITDVMNQYPELSTHKLSGIMGCSPEGLYDAMKRLNITHSRKRKQKS